MKSFFSLVCVLTVAITAGIAPAQTTFTNVIEEGGINFVHQIDGTCPGPPVGSGSAWADYDNDGDIDLYITNHGGPSGLYRNEGDTNGDGLPDFTNVAPELGVDEVGQVSHGVVFADYDNDGDQDLYITHWGGNTLYQNRLIETGSATFEDVTTVAAVGDSDRCITASWTDYDQDGLLDLYLAKGYDCLPYTRDSRDALFKNIGDGTFSNVSQYLCPDHTLNCDQINRSYSFSGGWFDMDNDNDPDMYLIGDVIAGGYPCILWRNDGPDSSGGWIFTDISVQSGTNYSINSMGLGIGDYDNDGYLDLAFSHAEGGFLMHNNGDGTFTDVSVPAGIRRTRTPLGDVAVTWATFFVDYDNDGWLDLFYVCGMISGLTTPQPDALFHNNHDGTFTDVSTVAGIDDVRRGRSASICDFDQDGFVDLFVGNYGLPVDLWHNESHNLGNTNHWLTILPQGTVSNRDGIGARFTLTTPDSLTQIREITSGPTHGGGDFKAAYFGLGSNISGILSVRWPSGLVENFGTVAADQVMHVVEGTALGVSDPRPVVSQFHLSQNYPNPFNPVTSIGFTIPDAGFTTLKVFDILGNEIVTLVNGGLNAGTHQVTFNAANFASGVYFYRLESGTFQDTKRLAVLK